ncbi:MAG: hypothetical protein DME07_07010 [Candidatus Rokuibacteriota bacterium]|nr:MAG: hypothetical protein DME07_07010 [Candidatus Rokubacteria bacterium]
MTDDSARVAMSRFSKALEQAERDLAQGEPAPSTSARPPAFSAPTPQRITRASLEPRHRAADPREEHLVSLHAPHSAAAERYRMLRHVVESLRKNTNLQVLAVTSPGAGDGKTTTSINLAGALAQSTAERVLLADVDLRRPSVARQLGLDGSRGSLVNALVKPGLALEDIVEQLPEFNLSVLQAGEATDTTYELLKSPRLDELVDEARRHYDYIVLDTPPFVPVPDGRLITKSADGVLVVVAANRTPRGALAEAVSLIDPAKIVGFVFNSDDSPTNASYYYGGGYGKSARPPLWRHLWRSS